MAYEIKWHFDNFVYSVNLDQQLNQSTNYYPNGSYTGLGIEFLIQSFLYEHCKTIDIAEKDVYNQQQARQFKYNEGIRTRYKWTKADPYMEKSGKRSKNVVAVANETQWRKELGKYAK